VEAKVELKKHKQPKAIRAQTARNKMKIMKNQTSKLKKVALLAVVLMAIGTAPSAWAGGGGKKANPGILPPQSHAFGKSYAEWSAKWWQWFLEQPVVGGPTDPSYDIGSHQSGKVWFLASALSEPVIEIPTGTALFIPLVNVECSSLEAPESGFHGDTAAEQAECAAFWGDHIVDPACIIDGREVDITEDYRATSPQFSFTAPTPWVFGDTGGAGTAVGDGYYVMVAPLSVGEHTITITGKFHLSAEENGGDPFDFETYVNWHIRVVPAGQASETGDAVAAN
jgi:hypothetical protein